MQRLWIKLFLVLSSFGSIAQAVEMNQTIVELPEALHDKVPGLNPGYVLARPTVSAAEDKPALLIYLHGGGSGGNHIRERLGRNAPVKYWNQQETHPFMIMAPQCFPHQKWKAESLQVLLEHLKETVEFDHSRIYLSGFSMGGYGTWLWAATYPDNFAAIAPMAGGIGIGGPKDVSPDLEQWLDNLATIPTWIFHGGGDTVVPVQRSEQMYQGLRQRGLKDLGLTIIPSGNHNIQGNYKNPKLYNWMLKHRTE
jgi:predicted peptidase